MNCIVGKFIDGSAIQYTLNNGKLVKSLLLASGEVKDFDCDYWGDFKCGLAVMDYGSHVNYIDRRGKVVSKDYDFGDDFSENRTFVWRGDKTYLVNEKFEILKEYEEGLIFHSYSQGICRGSELLESKNIKQDYFYDLDGVLVGKKIKSDLIVCPYTFSDPNDDYSEGLVRFSEDGKFGFSDLYGVFKIPPVYDWCSKFNGGVATVCAKGKYGFIDRENGIVLPFEFDEARLFGTYVCVKVGEFWRFLKMDGSSTNEINYQDIQIFQSGYIAVKINGRWGMLDENLNEIMICNYDVINYFCDGLAKVFLDGQPRIVSFEGQFLCDN